MFERLLGNDAAKHSLRRLIGGGRVPNSLLFCGPDGVGKREFAIELARAFMCTSQRPGDVCGECPACVRAGRFDLPKADKKDDFKQVFFSGHPDVGTVVPYNRNILVDAIRELEREANFLPYEGKARFFIIDDADKMNDAASNALLKTLEEPPAGTYIVLISSRPDSLLQTIRSRCQTVRFAPVEESLIVRHLAENGLSKPDAELAARLCRGSVGTALSIDLSKFRELRSSMLGVLQDAIIRKDIAAVLRTSEQINDAKNKDDFEMSIHVLESLARDAWLMAKNAAAEAITNRDISGELTEIANRAASLQLSSFIAAIEDVRLSLQVNINRKIASDALLTRLASA
ncbi:MAG: DNA polymerase III subunit delta' [Pyrinomonadaceae bacterium]|nr:DNA polymerase III subunit delta' [Pyrinomonadaceae bacterium]